MSTADMERELAAIADQDLKEARETAKMPSTQEPVQFRPKAGPTALVDQVNSLERIEQQLVDRIRREDIEARCTVERKVAEAHAYFARSLGEETARLERERKTLIRQATDEYYAKLHELNGLIRGRR